MAQVPADSVGMVLDSVFAAPKYHWVRRNHPFQWVLEQMGRFLGWFDRLATTAPLAYWGVVTLAVVVLVVIFVHAGTLLFRTIRVSSLPEAETPMARGERRDGAWYRAQAARLGAEGRYAAAMRAQFEGILLDLSAAGAVRWHPSKTPREYLREARLGPDELDRLARLVDGVYSASFAGAAFGAGDWERWRTVAAGSWRVQ